MTNFEIDSYHYNEHTKELVLYKGNRIYITICYDNTPTNEEIDEMIKGIEDDQQRTDKFFNNLNN